MAEVWTIGRLLKWTEQFFSAKGIENPRLDAEVLLVHLLKKERIYLYVHFDEPLEMRELAAFRALVRKRAAHIPVALILGEKEFMGLRLSVTEATLVPRPDTEILVQAAIDRLKARQEETGAPAHFADIGTGTGAVALAVLHYLAKSTAETVDISSAACEVAQRNAAALALTDRITFHTGDLLAPLAGKTFDAILSNPPYVPDADIASLAPEVQRFEPHAALSGGADGLDFYRRLTKDAPAMLEAGGFMALEVGIHQAKAVVALMKVNPRIGRTEILRDYAGMERVVVGWRR